MQRRNGVYGLAVALGLMLITGCSESDATAGKAAAHPGEETYNRFCFSCLASGVAGAPKLGDKAAWAPRIAKGQALLLQSTLRGVPPGMPAMGLCTSCTAEDLETVVDYMVQQSR